MRNKAVAIALISLVAVRLWADEPTGQDEYISNLEREHATDAPVASPASHVEPAAEVVASEASYAELDGKSITGFVAHPANGAAHAGIIVIHEWWGLNDNIRSMTRRLAGEGYIALAVDLYEGEVAADREVAATLARSAAGHPERVLGNLRQAIDYLRQERVEKIGVIGWCFGGGWSLRTALSVPDEIDAAVIYYGRVTTNLDDLEPLAAPLLGIFGAADGGIPVATVREFQTSLDSLGKNASIFIYEGAEHAFANPSGTRYDKDAAEDAWAKTLSFFAQHLR